MEISEIRELAINGSNTYYDYLVSKNRGLQRINVLGITEVDESMLSLKLSARIHDTEVISFENIEEGKTYSENQIKIVEYDSEKRILIIKVNLLIYQELRTLEPHKIKVVSNLRFLVTRVKEWYDFNGLKIQVPTKNSHLASASVKFHHEDSPNEGQIIAIKKIFEQPFTYIWGAPGTGKTQFVLSYSVINYVQNNDTVLVLAPTNNAIEQVLDGLIKVTDKWNISKKKIIRLGTPSKDFADKHPEVCEVKGMQKAVEEIKKIIENIKEFDSLELKKKKINYLLIKLDLFDEVIVLESEREKSESSKTRLVADNKKLLSRLSDKEGTLSSYNTQKSLLTKQLNSTINKFKRLFSSSQDPIEIEISVLIKKAEDLEVDRDDLVGENAGILDEINFVKKEIRATNNDLADLINEIKILFNDHIPDLDKKLSSINEVKLTNIKSETKVTLIKIKDEISVKLSLKNEYEELDLVKLERRLDVLQKNSTSIRLKSTKVIACTLDYYIYAFKEEMPKVSHIFLDEAGYANSIKALTLFSNDLPITFLGDHMQLPPVCEMNDSDFKKVEYQDVFIWSQSAIYLEGLFLYNKAENIKHYFTPPEDPFTVMKKYSLKKTHRFGESLSSILEKAIYTDGFESAAKSETKIFYTLAEKVEDRKSRISKNEAEKIKIIVGKLNRRNTNSYTILTPYNDQKYLLGKVMPKENFNLNILSVHGSQGKEWDIVILSVADSMNDKWFTDSLNETSRGLNLINTAVSRTKQKLIIVCDHSWKNASNQLLSKIIEIGEEF